MRTMPHNDKPARMLTLRPVYIYRCWHLDASGSCVAARLRIGVLQTVAVDLWNIRGIPP